jgi:hypothetical protein
LIISFAKYSVLYLYLRIFGKALAKPLIVIGVLQTIWMITCVCMALFRCDPVAASWDPLLQATAKCLDFELVVLVAEPVNCALDFVMVIIPVNPIKKLQLSLQKKIVVSTIFLFGGL